MTDSVQMSITGLDKTLDRIKALPVGYKTKGMRFAVRKGANLVRDSARLRARALDDPESPEVIADNITVRFSSRRYRRTGDIMFRVGVLGGARQQGGGGSGNPGGDTFHWRFREFGTRNSAAQPFMRPAAEENISNVFAEVATQLDRWTARQLKKMGAP